MHITKRDATGTVRRDFATGGGIAMAHLPQMYSLYELYFAAALRRSMAANTAAGDTAQLRQFYIDREFDRFPLHTGRRAAAAGRQGGDLARLAGRASAKRTSTRAATCCTTPARARRTRWTSTALAEPPDVAADRRAVRGARDEERRRSRSSACATRRAPRIGAATFTVDYGRPLARGRELFGKLLPYDHVWRTGANAATQFTTSAPITLAGISAGGHVHAVDGAAHRSGRI